MPLKHTLFNAEFKYSDSQAVLSSDELDHGLSGRVFGPSKAAALLEGSKSFLKAGYSPTSHQQN